VFVDNTDKPAPQICSQENQKSNLPLFVAFQITSKCNSHCSYCYARKDVPELDTERCKEIIRRVAESGIQNIAIAGRESLLRKDLSELVDCIKEYGCQAIVQTNGSLLTQEIIKRLRADWISFTVDALNAEISQMLGRLYLDPNKICQIINDCAKSNTKVVVHTVVSLRNYDCVKEIGELMSVCQPNVWKLRQVVSRELSRETEKDLLISQDDFGSLVKNIQKQFPSLNIISVTSQEENRSCLIIWPDGTIVVPEDREHKVLGQALTDDLNEVWQKANYNRSAHLINITKTYLC